MKRVISRIEAEKRIEKFFERKRFSAEEVRKIKRLAMKYKIKIGNFRKFFCKKCFSKLKGRISVTKNHKSVICQSCNFKNKYRI